MSQQRPDGGGTHPDAELAQLPADPHAAPPGVLSGHPQDQCCGLRVDRWPARRALLAVGPLASDQRAVPAQQRLGCDEQRCPPLSGSTRLAASRTRSAAVNLGRPVLRRSTRSCCRSTRISRSLVPSSPFGRTSRRVSTRTVSQHEEHRRMVRKRLLTTRTQVSAPHMLREAGVFGQEPWIERLVDGHGGSTRTASRSPWMSVDAVGDRVRRASPGEAVGQDCDLQRLRAVAG